MPFHASSYFGGLATVLATVAIGFGGGVMMTDAFVGKSEKAASPAEPPGRARLRAGRTQPHRFSQGLHRRGSTCLAGISGRASA
jgi:hypothetical protein